MKKRIIGSSLILLATASLSATALAAYTPPGRAIRIGPASKFW